MAIGESKLGNAYENEYVFTFRMSQDKNGDLKVNSSSEFIDSKYREEFLKKEMAAADHESHA